MPLLTVQVAIKWPRTGRGNTERPLVANHHHQRRQVHSEKDHQEWVRDRMGPAISSLIFRSSNRRKGYHSFAWPNPLPTSTYRTQYMFLFSLKANFTPGIMPSSHLLFATDQNSLVSPMAQVSNTPVSGIPLVFNASFNNLGGSSTSSIVSTHVPQ